MPVRLIARHRAPARPRLLFRLKACVAKPRASFIQMSFRGSVQADVRISVQRKL